MRIIANLLKRLPKPLVDRLIALKTTYPTTPLKQLPQPVRTEVKHILTSATPSAKSNPTPKPHSTPPPPVTTNSSASAQPITATPRPALTRTPAPLATIIGTDTQTGGNIAISISQQAKQQGVFIIGANGTGKTNIIKTMITSDLQAGLGLCLIEPHSDLTAQVLGSIPHHRLNDVVYLDVEDWENPFGLNIFEVPHPRNIRTRAATASFISHLWETIWNSGTETPRLMQNLRAVTRTLTSNPGSTFSDIPPLYGPAGAFEQKVTVLNFPPV